MITMIIIIIIITATTKNSPTTIKVVITIITVYSWNNLNKNVCNNLINIVLQYLPIYKYDIPVRFPT